MTNQNIMDWCMETCSIPSYVLPEWWENGNEYECYAGNAWDVFEYCRLNLQKNPMLGDTRLARAICYGAMELFTAALEQMSQDSKLPKPCLTYLSDQSWDNFMLAVQSDIGEGLYDAIEFIAGDESYYNVHLVCFMEDNMLVIGADLGWWDMLCPIVRVENPTPESVRQALVDNDYAWIGGC